MKKIGHDHYCQYEYYDIKDFAVCCTCRHFYDNEMETRFECGKNERSDDCYEVKEEYED